MNGLLLQDTVVEYVQTRNVIPAHYHCRLCSMCAPEAQCSRRNRLQRASFFLPLVRGSNRILPRPNKKNDGRLSPQKRLAAPGLDRVQQGNATSGLRISLGLQFEGSVVSLGSPFALARCIVAPSGCKKRRYRTKIRVSKSLYGDSIKMHEGTR